MATTVESPVEELKPQRKEVEVLKVLAEKVRGHVKWYSASKRYGFISRNDDGGDLFVHRSVISSYSKRFPSLRSGEEVEFSIVETNHGIEATLVTGPNGQPVKGIRPMNRRYRTSSEPNDQTIDQYANPEMGNDAASRAKQGGRRSRGPRRNTRTSNSVGDTLPAVESNEVSYRLPLI
ncbi:unnamed protein product [Dicrocoelium dendriticum]|nr:unnamed protein product [Dicrocoelium dendriticum]